MMVHFLRWQFVLLYVLMAGLPSYAQHHVSTTEILTIHFTCPDSARAGDTVLFEAQVTVHDGWHVYSPDQENRQKSLEPFGIEFFNLPKSISKSGALTFTKGMGLDGGVIYMGKGNVVQQKIIVDPATSPGSVRLQGRFVYQGCNDQFCYPAMEIDFSHVLTVGDGAASDVADQAWEDLIASRALFEDEAQYKAYADLKPLAMRRYEDQRYQHRAHLAFGFFNDFPDDERRISALLMLLSADPIHVAPLGNETLDSVLYWRDVDSKAFMRAIQIDTAARNEWLRQGEQLSYSILQDPTVADTTKEKITFAIFARDFRYAAAQYRLLPKNAQEGVYWDLFDQYYWGAFIERFGTYASAFTDHHQVGTRAQEFLSALSGVSPHLADQYWLHLFKLSGERLKEQRSEGMQALQAVALQQLETSKMQSGELPLSMRFQSLAGQTIDLAQYKGKVVLLDFWASWCKPCLDEMPHLRALYQRYGNLGFEIVGICMDDESERDAVMELLEKLDVPWPQKFEGRGFQSDPLKLLYSIHALPTVWLLDQNGMVIHRNARGAVLEELLHQHLVRID